MSEEDFRAKLLEKGIDIDKVDLNNPQELLKLQKAIEEIESAKIEQAKDNAVEEIEQEVANEIKEVASSTADEVAEAVEDGATVEEALAEGIIDAAEEPLPPTTIYGQHFGDIQN